MIYPSKHKRYPNRLLWLSVFFIVFSLLAYDRVEADTCNVSAQNGTGFAENSCSRSVSPSSYISSVSASWEVNTSANGLGFAQVCIFGPGVPVACSSASTGSGASGSGNLSATCNVSEGCNAWDVLVNVVRTGANITGNGDFTPFCGNGAINSGEQCDGGNLNGHSCTTLGSGFDGGTLSCNASCQFNTSACTTPPGYIYPSPGYGYPSPPYGYPTPPYGYPTPPLPDPSVDLVCSPSSIAFNGTANVSWTSNANVSSCTVSPTGWTGVSGSQSTGNLTSNTTYSITCNPTTATTIRTFTSSGTFTPPTGVTSVEYLVVAGGGAGGSWGGAWSGGGGGAGGMWIGSVGVTAGTPYAITVGGGGTPVANADGGNGGNTVFQGVATVFGGGGGSGGDHAGVAGGSGGGGLANNGSFPGGAGTAPQGNAGGSGAGYVNNVYVGGGGGGAGGAGGGADPNNPPDIGTPGNGGPGLPSSISGSSVIYAGGGGGGNGENWNFGSGGSGGGGSGAGSGTGGAGATNSGSGGGGGGNGGAGGSGIVIIKYTTPTATDSCTVTVAPQPNHTLTVNSSGASGVAITGSPSTNSGTTNYTKTIVEGTSLSLTAPVTAGLTDFSNWSGCNSVSGTGNRTCNVTMSGNQTVTATYTTTIPAISNVTISSPTVRADNSTQYTITVTGSDPGGGGKITHEFALINFQGSNDTARRGFLTWYFDTAFTGWNAEKNKMSCTGGGIAAIQQTGVNSVYGHQFMNLDFCITSVSGNTRTTAFNVRFDPSFITPTTGNDISGFVQNTNNNNTGWVNFNTNFSLVRPTISTGGLVQAGAGINVSWSNILVPVLNDLIRLYSSSAAVDTAHIASNFVRPSAGPCLSTQTGASAGGTCLFAIPPGATPGATYEFRLFSSGGGTKLATSNPFSVTATNPTNPIINPAPPTGETNASVGPFGFTSTDPGGHRIRYRVDLDSDQNTTDEWLPPDIGGVAQYVNSGTGQSKNFSWSTPGIKTYRVKAQNEHGEESGWSSNSCNISNPPLVYNLSRSSPLVIVPKTSGNAFGDNIITITKTSGTSQFVNLSASGHPSGVTASFSGGGGCNPSSGTCPSTLLFTVPPNTPVGTYLITITGNPASGQTTFNLRIDGAPIGAVSCSPSPSPAKLGETVTWTATIAGGAPPGTTYSWRGNNIPTSPAPNTNPFRIVYSTIGQKNAIVTVTTTDSVVAECTSPVGTVKVIFDPDFEEF